MKKFKHWLIKKLGGYVIGTPPMISKHTMNPVAVFASTSIPLEIVRKNPEGMVEMLVKEKCAEELARAIIRTKGLCDISRMYEERFGYAVFKVQVIVIPQEGNKE